MIKNCPTCLTFRTNNAVPQEPWTKLAADLFQLYGHYFLLVVDYTVDPRLANPEGTEQFSSL